MQAWTFRRPPGVKIGGGDKPSKQIAGLRRVNEWKEEAVRQASTNCEPRTVVLYEKWYQVIVLGSGIF
jgi:hypothetical protein